MNFKAILTATAMTLFGSIANAAVLDSTHAGGNFDLLADFYSFQDTFPDGTAGATLSFTFDNTSATGAVVTVSSASIAQLPNAYFTDGATVSWSGAGVVTSAAQGVGSGGNVQFFLGAGDSDTLNITFGNVVVGANQPNPDVDFLVSASLAPVPVPASILLMGTALAGLGVMRRRKKAA